MSTVLDAEPIVLEQELTSVECFRHLCRSTARWSTIWTCGEVAPFCETHRIWAQEASRRDGIHCECPGVYDTRIIHLVAVVPL